MRTVVYKDWITRQYIKQNSNAVFLFGDNLLKIGMGGQAFQFRGQQNSIGIPTKKLPSMSNDSFFNDEQLQMNKQYINQAFSLIPDQCIVVIPSQGIGTGLSQLPQRAPQTYQYILYKIQELTK